MPPYKDPDKQKEAVQRAHDRQFPVISIRIPRSKTVVYEALQKAASDANITIPEYMRRCIETQLRMDGYLHDE